MQIELNCKNGTIEKIASYLVLIIGISYIIIFAYYLGISVYLVPYMDIVVTIDEYMLTDNVLAMIWERHHEHRIVFSKIIMIFDIIFFGGALYLFAVVSFINFICCAAIIIKEISSNSLDSTLKIIITGVLLITIFRTFTLEIHVMAANIQHSFVTLFFLLSIITLVNNTSEGTIKNFWFGMSILCGVLTSISSLNGFIVWPILLWVTWVLRLSKPLKLLILIAGIITIVVYLKGYSHQWGNADPKKSIFEIVLIGKFLIYFFAGPWAKVPVINIVGFATGITVITAGIYFIIWQGIVKRTNDRMYIIFIGILMFSGGTAFLVSLGRINIGSLGATSGRYGIYVVIAHAALICLLSQLINRYWRNISVRRGVLLLSLVGGLVLFAEQVIIGERYSARAKALLPVKSSVMKGERNPEILKLMGTHPDYAASVIDRMQKNHIYFFRHERKNNILFK